MTRHLHTPHEEHSQCSHLILVGSESVRLPLPFHCDSLTCKKAVRSVGSATRGEKAE